MTLPIKTRLAKRKLEIKEVRKEKQTVTSKKHDKNCFNEKNVKVLDDTDTDLLKELNDALLEEVKANEKAIENLKKKEKKYLEDIKNLTQKIEKDKQPKVNAGCQTDDADLLFCEECEFPAETLFELGEHVGEFHTGLRIPCNFCDDIYTSKKDLEKHEIEVHNQLSEYNCNHTQKVEDSKAQEAVFKCKFCGENYKSKKELMKHNKDKHEENLKSCWNFKKGACFYGNDCWYSHERLNINYTNEVKEFEKSEVILKIFDFMEKVTEKITKLEQTNKSMKT